MGGGGRAGQDTPRLARGRAEAGEIRSTGIHEWTSILQPRQRKPWLVVAVDEWRARQLLGSATKARLSFPRLFHPRPYAVVRVACQLEFETKSRISLSSAATSTGSWTLQPPELIPPPGTTRTLTAHSPLSNQAIWRHKSGLFMPPFKTPLQL